MKNKKLLILLLPLLLGCNGGNSNSASSSKLSSQSTQSSSSTKNNESSINTTPSVVTSSNPISSSSPIKENPVLDLADTLVKLSQGVKVEVNGTESYDGDTTNLYLRNTSKNKEFSFIQYRDAERQNAALHEYYTTQNDDNLVYSTRLNLRNTYNYYKVYNPITYEWFTWDEGYNNPFLALTVDSFEKVDDVTYSLKSEDAHNVSSSLTNLLYGNPGLTLNAFTMFLENDTLKFEAIANFNGSTNYSYTFNATVLEIGEKVEMDYRCVPFAEVEDAEFDAMIAALKGNNYTATVEEFYDGELDCESVYYSNPDKVYFESFEYQSGFYVTEDDMVQEIEFDGIDFYKVGAPMEGNIEEVMPSFAIAREVFDVEDGVYKLKNGVEGDTSAYVVLETFLPELDEFTITKTSDGYVFSNVSGDEETRVTFTDIGTTDVGFDVEDVLEPVAAVTWADILEDYDYQLLVDIAGEEVAAVIPVPDNYSEWYQLSEEPEYVMLVSEAGEGLEDDLFLYSMKLMDTGFIISEEEGMNGGIMGLAEINVNGEDHVLVIEFLPYEGMFCIMIYIGE